ncbi:MAG: right-handed parallel beta-helix repeat-containing protein [Lachnospiraceae bacterium]|nr:right-handed parallel beta-helix repeat-containing protein [Lachnospiraceae bacterium]
MRTGTLSKFNKKKNLWISEKHPLFSEPIEFRTLYAASVLMHARLNPLTSPFNNFQIERLISKGFNLSSKDTITMMDLSKDIQLLIDSVIAALDTQTKRLLFLLDLFNVSLNEYQISKKEQQSIDLFADLLRIDSDSKNLISSFATAAQCKEYDKCKVIAKEMKKHNLPLSMTDLSYYMLGYSYTKQIHPETFKENETYNFRGNCHFHGTISIPENCTVHISNAIVKVDRNIVITGGTLIIENSYVEFNSNVRSSDFEHCFITSRKNSQILFKKSTFQCGHNGGLLYSLKSEISIIHCQVENTSFVSSILANGNRLHLKHCQFKNCFSKQNGGAIFIPNGVSQISHCNFINCNSHNGGAIFASKQTVIQFCYFENCCAVEFGSAIYYNGEIRSNVVSCNSSNCFPKDSVIVQYISSSEEYYIEKETELSYSTIFDCPITITKDGIWKINNSTIYIKYPIICNGLLSMNGSKLIGQNFQGRDLIVFETAKNCHFTNCEFDGSNEVGIFRAVRARLHLNGCVFRNTAHGRAIYNAFLPKIESCVFSHCQEGALYCQGGIITNSQFINCQARNGGGIVMYGTGGKIENCHFQRCISNYRGGAIDTSGSYHIVNCTYKDCSK